MNVIAYKLRTSCEWETIYTGIDCISGGWIATSSGDPYCLEDVSENLEYCNQILSIIAGDTSACEFCEYREATGSDYAYVADLY